MSEEPTKKSGYNHIYWALAVGCALVFWADNLGEGTGFHLISDALLCAVLVGWLNSIWQGAKARDAAARAAQNAEQQPAEVSGGE